MKKEKICLTTTGSNLDSSLDLRFGRTMFFLITDSNGNLTKVIKNPAREIRRGAGVMASQTIVKEAVNVVITGNIGPNAFMLLNNSGIKVFLIKEQITARQAIKKYHKGTLTEVRPPTVN